MARNREELYEMLDKADKAGDTAGARDIYKWIQETPAEPPPPPPVVPGPDKPQISYTRGAVGGLEHGLHRASRGLLNTAEFMAGKPISNQVKKLHQWAVSKGMPSIAPTDEMMAKEEQFVKDAPWTANVGQVVGEAVPEMATAFLGAPAAEKVASTVLPKFAQKLAPAVADIGLNAATSATFAPEDKAKAAAWAAGGSAAGRALPHAVNYARKGANAATDFVVPGRSAANKLTKHLGSEADEVTSLARKGLEAGDSALPQTTAGMTGNVKVAGLEAGIPGRGLVDLSPTRVAQEKAKQSALTKLTAGGDEVGALTKEADTIASEGTERLRRMPLGKERKAGVVASLESLKTVDEVIGDTHLQGAITRAQNAINDPNASTLILTTLKNNLPKDAKFDRVRNVLMEAANERSKFIASAAEEGAGAVRDKATAAQASKSLRGEYLGEGGAKLKDINELSLNRSLTKPGLDSDVVEQGAKLSDELRRADLYKNTQGAPTDIKKTLLQVATDNPLGAAVAAFLSAGKTAPLHAALKVRDHLTKKAVDQAVADPKKWVEIMGAKQARGAALEAWEKALYKTLRPATMAGSQAGQAIGEQDAP
jgi:hypothetical protein